MTDKYKNTVLHGRVQTSMGSLSKKQERDALLGQRIAASKKLYILLAMSLIRDIFTSQTVL